MSAEANEAKSTAAQAMGEAAQKKLELEQTLAHSSTLESRLQAASKEKEAAQASEAFALAEVCNLHKLGKVWLSSWHILIGKLNVQDHSFKPRRLKRK